MKTVVITRAMVKRVMDYIIDKQTEIEGEWGDGRTWKQLKKEDELDFGKRGLEYLAIYNKLNDILKSQ